MKSLAGKFSPLMIALVFCATCPQISLAASTAAASEASSSQAVMARWQEARKKYDAVAANYQNDPAKAKLVAEYSKTLDEACNTLKDVLGLTSAAAPDAKKTAAALSTLKTKIRALGVQQAKLKTDKAFTDSSSDLISILGNALSQRQQATQSAVGNLR